MTLLTALGGSVVTLIGILATWLGARAIRRQTARKLEAEVGRTDAETDKAQTEASVLIYGEYRTLMAEMRAQLDEIKAERDWLKGRLEHVEAELADTKKKLADLEHGPAGGHGAPAAECDTDDQPPADQEATS